MSVFGFCAGFAADCFAADRSEGLEAGFATGACRLRRVGAACTGLAGLGAACFAAGGLFEAGAASAGAFCFGWTTVSVLGSAGEGVGAILGGIDVAGFFATGAGAAAGCAGSGLMSADDAGASFACCCWASVPADWAGFASAAGGVAGNGSSLGLSCTRP